MPVDESTPEGVETVRKGVGGGATDGALEHAAKSAPTATKPTNQRRPGRLARSPDAALAATRLTRSP